MNRDELNEKIYAAALGCLDKKELLLFNETILSNPDFADKNFGIYQQLASLLPLTLKSSEPDKSIKDRIARKVYRLKDTTPGIAVDSVMKPDPPAAATTTEKISVSPKDSFLPEEKTETEEETQIPGPANIINSPEIPDLVIEQEEEKQPKRISGRFEKINTLAEDETKDDIVLTQRKLDIPIRGKKIKRKHVEKPPKEYDEISPVLSSSGSDDPEKKNKFFVILLILISAVAMIGSALVYIKFSSENDKNILQINSLTTQLNKLNEEAEADKKLLGLLESSGLKIISMNPLKGDSVSFVRILLNNTLNSGFLQTNFSEPVLDNKPLKLWSVSRGEKKLIVTFSGVKGNQYHPINLEVPAASTELILVITKNTAADSSASADSLLFTASYFYNPSGQ